MKTTQREAVYSSIKEGDVLGPSLFPLYVNYNFRTICQSIHFLVPDDITKVHSFQLSSLPQTNASNM